ncbi:MAG TPA: hypothetical protein ENI76_04880, partial [Ignavibacteria bacterium]|nr:hypothetical protein [Ignavibacteria bacterium]
MENLDKITKNKIESRHIPEIPQENWESLFLIQRHGEYINDAQDSQEQDDHKKGLGSLTTEGIKEVREKTSERLEEILKINPEKTDFLLIHSPTSFKDNLGRRAEET